MHTRRRFEWTHGRSSPVPLTKKSPRRILTCAREVHQRNPWMLPTLKFENRSRTTCSRFLQSFALPDKVVQLQFSSGTLRRESATGWFGLSFTTKTQVSRKVHTSDTFHDVRLQEAFDLPQWFYAIFVTSLVIIYIYITIYYRESSRIPQHSKGNWCGCKQATAHAHVQSRCMMLNFDHTKISNRSKKNEFRDDEKQIRICYIIPRKTQNRSKLLPGKWHARTASASLLVFG